MDRNLLLHLYGASRCPFDAIEHDQQQITPGLNDPAAMLIDRSGSIRFLGSVRR